MNSWPRFYLLVKLLFELLFYSFKYFADRLLTSLLDLITLQIHPGWAPPRPCSGLLFYWDLTDPKPHRCQQKNQGEELS